MFQGKIKALIIFTNIAFDTSLKTNKVVLSTASEIKNQVIEEPDEILEFPTYLDAAK